MREPTIFPAVALIGGADGALDAFPIATLQDEDGALVMTSTYTYTYTYDATSEVVESSPDVIMPDDAGAAPGRWLLTRSYIARDSDMLEENDSADFAAITHATSHTDGADQIADSTTEDSGLMSADAHNVLWASPNFKNKLINSNFKLWQRGASVSSGTGYVTADRWLLAAVDGTITAERSTIVPGDIAGSDSQYSMKLVSTDVGSLTSGYTLLMQRIESVRVFAGRTATFSFWAWCAGALKIAVTFRQFFGTGGSPSADTNFIPATGHEITCVASTWTKFTMTVDVPSIVGKTIGTAGDDSLGIIIWFSAGSDRNVDPYFITIGRQNPFGSTFYITDLLLEPGSIATQYPDLPHGVESLMCYRYYWRNRIGQLNSNAYADNALSSFRFFGPVPMRTIPTAESVFTNCVYTFVDSMVWDVLNSNTVNGGLLYFLANCSGTNKTNIYVTFSATDYVALSAEL